MRPKATDIVSVSCRRELSSVETVHGDAGEEGRGMAAKDATTSPTSTFDRSSARDHLLLAHIRESRVPGAAKCESDGRFHMFETVGRS